MKHKERPTATLILCVIIGAVIFSEFTPAVLFESDSLRKTSNDDFARIKGKQPQRWVIRKDAIVKANFAMKWGMNIVFGIG